MCASAGAISSPEQQVASEPRQPQLVCPRRSLAQSDGEEGAGAERKRAALEHRKTCQIPWAHVAQFPGVVCGSMFPMHACCPPAQRLTTMALRKVEAYYSVMHKVVSYAQADQKWQLWIPWFWNERSSMPPGIAWPRTALARARDHLGWEPLCCKIG